MPLLGVKGGNICLLHIVAPDMTFFAWLQAQGILIRACVCSHCEHVLTGNPACIKQAQYHQKNHSLPTTQTNNPYPAMVA